MRLPPDARLRADVGSLLEEAGESPSDELLDPILIHLRLLARWNDAYGLTRITEWLQVLDRHLRESLMPLRWIAREPGRLLDVGSGNGYPALPILACRPGLAGTLLERSERKGLFLEAVVRESGWSERVVVEATDAERYEPDLRTAVEGSMSSMSAADARVRRERPEGVAAAPSSGVSRGTRSPIPGERRGSPSSKTSRAHGESPDRLVPSRMSAADITASSDESRFDYVVSRATLAPSRLLELAPRWLRPGGRVFLFAGNVGGRRNPMKVTLPLVLTAQERVPGRTASTLFIYELQRQGQ